MTKNYIKKLGLLTCGSVVACACIVVFRDSSVVTGSAVVGRGSTVVACSVGD